MIEQITIPQTSLPPEEILLEDRGQSIALFNEFLFIQSAGKWDLPKDNDPSIRTKVFCDNAYIIDKNNLDSFQMYFDNICTRYCIEISVSITTLVKISFGENDEHPAEARKRCKALFDKITKWKYGIDL